MHKEKQFKFRTALKFVIFLTAVFLFAKTSLVLAQAPSTGGVDVFGGQKDVIQDALGLGAQDPRITIAKIIRVLLGFLGLITVCLMLYGGFLWMTSEGNEQQLETAKRTLRNAVIGLLIILSAFGIATFVLNKLMGATGGTVNGLTNNGTTFSLTAMGNGIVQSHYPERNAVNIPRNTKIVITFKEPMMAGDLFIASGTRNVINPANIVINNVTLNGETGTAFTVDVLATSTMDLKTFVFKPITPLGSPSEKMIYSVSLSKNIRKANGRAAFSGVSTVGYTWRFEVSTVMDLTPPQIESVFPIASSTMPRNVIIQVNFNEAVDPTSASGLTSAFDNIQVQNLTDSGVLVDGRFSISNQYRTVEFVTDDKCGINSCGQDIYCLPGNKLLSPLVKAEPVPVEFDGTYEGVVDMCDNSLDGNNNFEQDGSPTDDYNWGFETSNVIDLTAPSIESKAPANGSAAVAPDTLVTATFNKLLRSSSLIPGNTDGTVYLGGSSAFWLSKQDSPDNKTTAIISHDPFTADTDLQPQFKSGINDIFQNCYKPCGGSSCPATAAAPSCCNDTPTAGASCP